MVLLDQLPCKEVIQMLLKLSELTDQDCDKDLHFNTQKVVTIAPVEGGPGITQIILEDKLRVLVKKPVEEVVDILKEHDRSLAV